MYDAMSFEILKRAINGRPLFNSIYSFFALNETETSYDLADTWAVLYASISFEIWDER